MYNVYFNNVLIPSFVTVTNIGIQALPDLENNLVSVGKLTGLYDMGTKKGGKKIVIEFMIKNASSNTIANTELLAEWLKGDDFKASKLVIPEFPNSYYMAKVNNSVEIEDLIKIGKGTIEFVLLNPNRIDTTATSTILTTNPQTIVYTGLAETYPTISIRILSSVSSIQVNFSNAKQSNFIKFVGSFNANDVIKLDMKTKKVTLNNNINMPILTLDSGFHRLIKGNNVYSNLNLANTEVTVIYNKEYL